MSDEPLLPPHGNYRDLFSYQKAEVVYDLTYRFAHRYLPRGDRTIDQMIQSARSGKQNILEGSKALHDLQGNRDQAHQRRPRQPRGATRRLPRLPPRPRSPALGK